PAARAAPCRHTRSAPRPIPFRLHYHVTIIQASLVRRTIAFGKKKTPEGASGVFEPGLCAGLVAVGLGHRAGVLALFGRIAIDELDDRHGRVVAVTEARLQHADIAAVAFRIAGAEHGEQLADLFDVTHRADRLATRMPSVTSFSTKGRSSLAFGNVVTICSCLIRLAAMLANMAVRWAVVRPSLRCAAPWRISYLLGHLDPLDGPD